MKHFRMLSVFALVVTGLITSHGQDMAAEVPGDHFSLEGALELFKKSESPEDFERLLNSPDSKVNNLDLNGDGYIDYIRVFDRQEGNVHVFILQAVISESENQDIAVIELEKLANGKAVLQIIGDADIYGVETIIEPTREVRTYAGTMTSNTVVNVWEWPVVYYVYSPQYVVWHSPWGWHHRAVWWRPWRPIVYVHYYNYWRPYRPYYSVCHTHRVVYAHNIYRPYRSTSVIVHNRHHEQVTRYRSTRGDDRNGRVEGEDRTRSTRGGNIEGRESFTGNAPTSADREVITLPARTQSRERTTNADIQRDPIDRTSLGRTRQDNNVRSDREETVRPPVKTNRNFETPDVQRDPIDRTSSGPTRQDTNVRPERDEPVRPSVKTNRTFETPDVQRSETRQRAQPEIQRSTPMRQQQDVPQRRTESPSPDRQMRSGGSSEGRSAPPQKFESPQQRTAIDRTVSPSNSGSPQRSNDGGAQPRTLKKGRQ